jgi:hypothetical protein
LPSPQASHALVIELRYLPGGQPAAEHGRFQSRTNCAGAASKLVKTKIEDRQGMNCILQMRCPRNLPAQVKPFKEVSPAVGQSAQVAVAPPVEYWPFVHGTHVSPLLP